MATPTLVGIGPTAVGASSSSVTVGWPAGLQTGDYAILCVESARNATTPSTPNGWSFIRLEVSPTDPEGAMVMVWGRYLPSGTMADVTVTGSMHLSGCIAVFRGVDPAQAYESSNTSYSAAATSTTLPAFTSLSSDGAGRLLFYAVATGAAGSYVSGVSSGPAVTVARASGHSSFEGGGLSLLVGASAIGAGTVAKNSVTFNTPTDSASAHFLLRPVPVSEIAGATSFQVLGAATGARLARASAVVGGAVTGAGALRGSAALGASAVAALSPAGTVRGAGLLAATLALSFAAGGGLGGAAGVAGTAPLQVASTAALTGNGAVAGTGSATLVATASGLAIPGMAGYGTVGMVAAGMATGSGALTGNAVSVLTWAATLSGNVPAAGAADLSIDATASLRADAGLVAVTPTSISAAAVPSGSAALAAGAALSLNIAPAALRGQAAFSGNAATTLVGNGSMQRLVRGAGNAGVTFVLAPATLSSLLQLEGQGAFALDAQGVMTAAGALRGTGAWSLSGSGQALRIVDPVIEEHWRVPSRRPVLLLTIGAPPLPVVTPISAVEITDNVDPHRAPELAGPESLTVVAGLDSAHLAWAYVGPKAATFVVELAEDALGSASGWALAGSTADLQYALSGLTNGTVWVRVYATLNGRNSSPTAAQPVTPIPSFTVQANTEAVAALQEHVETIDGVLEAQATDIVGLKARAAAVENDVGGLQEATDALAAADDLMAARVQAAEDSISAEAQRVTALSSSLEINRSVAGRTPLVFRQPSAPAVSGTRYNLLLQTAGLTSTTWAKTATVAASTVADPEGYLQAFRLTPSADGQYVRQDVSGLGSIAGRTFSFPVWIRADIAHTCSIRLIAGSAGTSEVLDVAAVNLWQRVNITHVYAGETDASLRVEIYPKQFGSTGQPNHSIDVFGPQLNEGAVRPFQRVGVANDYDGNGIPPLSTWYDSDDGNKEYGWQLSGGSMQWVLGSDTRIAATAAAAEELGTRVAAAEGEIVAQADDISTLNVRLTGNVNAVEALQVRVSSTEDGIEDYFASYSVTFDVNGKFSGFRSINNGLISAFEIDADVFSVTAAAGADALTWSQGVLTARKAGYSVKLGPGFGANSDLVLWYGPDGDSGTRTVENAKIAITKDGTRKLGSTQLNLGSGWSSGASITYSATAGSATISATAGVFRFGDQERSYGASSASVSGTPGTSVLYWLYYDDPGLTGGSKALMASTSVVDTFNSDGRVLLGSVTVAYPASGTSGGGGSGGSDCVDYDSVLADGRLVRDLQPGDLVECVDVRTGIRALAPLLAIGFGWADCYRVKTAHGEVIQSDTTPMDMPDGSVVRTYALAGHPVLQREHGFELATVEHVGPRRVCKPDLGDRMFFAGTAVDRCIATHNIRYKDPSLP